MIYIDNYVSMLGLENITHSDNKWNALFFPQQKDLKELDKIANDIPWYLEIIGSSESKLCDVYETIPA